MKNRARSFGLLALALAIVSPGFAARPLSDLVSPERRRVIVELAQQLTRPPVAVPVQTDLAHPFNPVGFDQPDPEEVKAAQAALAKGMGLPPGGPAPTGGPAPVPQQAGDREILEGLAMKLPNAGTMNVGGKPILVIGSSRVKVGDRFTVTSNGQDYELELTAIDRTTFTLRYHGEEFTRPSRKSP